MEGDPTCQEKYVRILQQKEEMGLYVGKKGKRSVEVGAKKKWGLLLSIEFTQVLVKLKRRQGHWF